MKRTYQVSSDVPENERPKALKELKLGYLNLSDEMFEQAEMNFLLALQFDKKCADAYWGQMLAKFQIANEDDLYTNPVTYKSAIYLPECQNALQFADENQKKIFDSLLESIYKINEGDNY